MPGLSPTVTRLLNEQLAHEAYNANLYFKMGAWLKIKGLNNIGDFFTDTQAKEEYRHKDLIMKYLTDRDMQVLMLEIPEVTYNISSVKQIGQLFIDKELDTTQKLKDIASAALTEQDFMTFGFIQEMLGYQREEEDEAITFQQRADMADDDWNTLVLWDAEWENGD